MRRAFIFTGFFVLCAIAPAASAVLPQKGICAHRGASLTHPENTLAAFAEAIRLGAHMIEFDVLLSKDSALVVIHDMTVDRTTNGTGRVDQLTLAELKALDAGSWKSPMFRGEKIPTLEETLTVMPTNIWLNVHLKGGAALGRKVTQKIIAMKKHQQAFLACGSEAAKAARLTDSRIMICNMERQSDTNIYVEETIAMHADFIQLKGPASVSEPLILQDLKNARIRINYYGTNDSSELQKLLALGIEFPLVDNLQAMLETAAATAGIQPLKPVYKMDNDNKTEHEQ